MISYTPSLTKPNFRGDPVALGRWLTEVGGHVVVRGTFSLAWFTERCSVLRQRGAATFHQVWKVAAPVANRGLRTIKDISKKTFDCLRAISWRTIARRYKVPFLVLGGVLLAVILLIIIIEVPQRQAASWRGQPGVELKDLPKLENDARTTLLQGLGGLVLLSGLGFTLWNLRLTQDRQITEYYTRAVEQLGSDKLEVRLGAIYALERIARDSERDHWPIMEILIACVREHAPWPQEAIPLLADDLSPTEKSPEGKDQPAPKPALDIQAILTVLGRRTRYFGKGEAQRLDLSRTTLRGAYLREAHLEGAAFWHAHLEGAYLRYTHLEGAVFWQAHLERAILWQAHLERADLQYAYLEGADFREAHLERATLLKAYLERAILRQAHLERADLQYAHLKGADLQYAHLERAILWEAHLEEAILCQAHLERADLREAHLERAALQHAHLEGANLWEAHLEGANLLSAHLQGAEDLTVEQLSTVETLYRAELDPPLLAQIQQRYPHLREKPQPSGTLDLTGPIPIFRR